MKRSINSISELFQWIKSLWREIILRKKLYGQSIDLLFSVTRTRAAVQNILTVGRNHGTQNISNHSINNSFCLVSISQNALFFLEIKEKRNTKITTSLRQVTTPHGQAYWLWPPWSRVRNRLRSLSRFTNWLHRKWILPPTNCSEQKICRQCSFSTSSCTNHIKRHKVFAVCSTFTGKQLKEKLTLVNFLYNVPT